MRNAMRSLLALTLCLCLCLTGCGGETEEKELTADDARLYMEGLLKEHYLGEYDEDYLTLVGIHEHDAQDAYENGLAVEAQYFVGLYGIEFPSDDLYEEIRELYKEIYGQARFRVVSSVREESGDFTVEVEIEPIDIIRQSQTQLESALEPWYEKYPNKVQSTMTKEEWEAADQEWGRIIVDTVKGLLPQLGHLEARTVTVSLKQGEDGYYRISNEDFGKLNDLIIAYGADQPEDTPSPSPSPEESPEPGGTEVPEETVSPAPTGTPDPDAVQPPTTASPLPLPSPAETAEPSPAPTE